MSTNNKQKKKEKNSFQIPQEMKTQLKLFFNAYCTTVDNNQNKFMNKFQFGKFLKDIETVQTNLNNNNKLLDNSQTDIIFY